MIPNRIVVTTKDVMNITGKCNRSAQRLLKKIRGMQGKERRALVTLEEFCRHTGLKPEAVDRFMK